MATANHLRSTVHLADIVVVTFRRVSVSTGEPLTLNARTFRPGNVAAAIEFADGLRADPDFADVNVTGAIWNPGEADALVPATCSTCGDVVDHADPTRACDCC